MSNESSIIFQILTIIRIVVLSIGIIGNIISFIVFSRKTFRKNSINTYCRALAVFDCLTIVQLIKDVLNLRNSFDYMENWSDVSCKLFFYISMQYSSIPGWILVSFSLDKMLSMKTSIPNILKSKLFQWSVVAGIVLFHLLLYSQLLVHLKLQPIFFLPHIQICNFHFLSYFYPFLYAELAETCLIPFSIMIITSIVTIRLLVKSRDSLTRIGNASKQRRLRDIKYAVSSVSFNVFFIAFKMPFFIAYILTGSIGFYSSYFMQISFLLFLTNCSASFFTHFVTNSIFRREFYRLRLPTITASSQLGSKSVRRVFNN